MIINTAIFRYGCAFGYALNGDKSNKIKVAVSQWRIYGAVLDLSNVHQAYS